MAMITCPSCGEQISDKSEKCIHCGAFLPHVFNCPECGQQLEEGAVVCPKCGCPVSKENTTETNTANNKTINVGQESQPVYFAPKNPVPKKKIIAIIVVLILIVGGGIGAFLGVKAYKEKKAADEAAAYAANYSIKYATAANSMLSGAADAESAGHLIHDVWSNTIFDKSDSTTDKYTKDDNGSFNKDFNDSLAKLFKDSTFSSKLDGIKSNMDIVAGYMKDLQNPPEDQKNAYDAISDLYNSYLTLTGMAVNPTGSLTSFTDAFNKADTDFLNKYNMVKQYI